MKKSQRKISILQATVMANKVSAPTPVPLSRLHDF
jgi:hypothetical protein